jgi:hypothetical protein
VEEGGGGGVRGSGCARQEGVRRRRHLPRWRHGGVWAKSQAACRAWGRPEGRGIGPGEVGGDAWSGQELEVAPGTA